MRVVNPVTNPTAAQRLATTGLARVLPDSRKLVEAGFVLVVSAIALYGFSTTFDSWSFFAVSGIGLVIAVLVAHLVRALRGHWTIGLAGAAAAYFIFGGPAAMRGDLAYRILPTMATEQDLWSMVVYGWKQLLTTLPPVAGEGPFLALPFALALVFGAAAYGLAASYEWIAAPLIPSGILFALVIALGTDQVGNLLVQTALWGVAVLGWMAYRAHRRGRMVIADAVGVRWARVFGGAGIIAVATVVAVVAGPVWPGVDPPRDILRHHVQPPIDLNQYPSPMPTFRKFSSKALADTYYYDKTLMTVEGVEPGSLVRFAVLDSYDGWVWGAGGGGFRRVGTTIPAEVEGAPVKGTPVDMTITVGDVYASQAPLNIWIPSLGYSTSITFSGNGARAHEQAMAYDLKKGQGLALDQLKSGDVIHVTSIPMPTDTGGGLTPAGSLLVSPERTEFLAADLEKMTGGNVANWEQLVNMAKGFRAGGWSDGTRGDGDGQYTPGSGQDRLKAFLATLPKYAGSDEQYAAMYALAANRIGYPARVVFGAKLPAGGAIQGKDVTIWVEVCTTNGWVALPPDFFIPPRENEPEPPPPTTTEEPQNVQDIQPPNPQRPPGDLSNMDTQAQTDPPNNEPPVETPWWVGPAIWTGVGVGGFALLIGLLVGLKGLRAWWRRHRGPASKRIAGGWNEALDGARDLGIRIPAAMTRQEQAAAMGIPPLIDLARTTNEVMFQKTPPDQAIVDDYWASVRQTKSALGVSRKGLARLWSRITPRSLLPTTRHQ